MARAKRTDRADARRRYRATASAIATEETSADEGASAERRPDPSSPAAPPARPGITTAFRAAYHRPDVRGDLAALPALVRSPAFLVGLAVLLGCTIAISVAPRNTVSALLFQLGVADVRGFPAMTATLIAGFLARRASYLIGLILGLVATLAYAFFAIAILPVIVTEPLPAGTQGSLIIGMALLSPVLGLLSAAAAAWYRRFLSMSGARRTQARAGSKPKPKPRRR